jgi:prepilin-type N-terminal cleavage/methylation domain-containing protein
MQSRKSKRSWTHRNLRSASGFTLVELLVVIAIISMVTIATVPLLLPALDSRRIRESARLVSTQFTAAQSDAIAKGRPVGVWIDRIRSASSGSVIDATVGMDLYLCEVPQPYSGDTLTSTVPINNNGGDYSFTLSMNNDAQWKNTLRPGDLVRFNYRGDYYLILGDQKNKVATDPKDPSRVVIDPNPDQGSPPGNPQKKLVFQSTNPANPQMPSVTTSTPFQIIRQPVKLAGSAVQLPAGAVIDLIDSGMGSDLTGAGTDLFLNLIPLSYLQLPMSPTQQQIDDERFKLFTSKPTPPYQTAQPIIFMFSASGALDKLYFGWQSYNGASPRLTIGPYPITGPLHFLIGKREKAFQPTGSSNFASYYDQTATADIQSEKQNFRDLENIWVSINPQSGLVTSAEVANVDDAAAFAECQTKLGTAPTANQALAYAVSYARQFAQSAQTMGGK